MAKTELKNPKLYINRELSWLEFNQRVLEEGLDESLPLMERLKFLAITSSNLDEFFMIRVGGLSQLRRAGARKKDIAGLTPTQQLKQIAERVHRMIDEQTVGIHTVLGELREHGLSVLEPDQWNEDHRRFLRAYFLDEVMPVLTPLAVQELDPSPLIPALQLNIAAALRSEKNGESERVVVIPVPARFRRFVTIPSEQGVVLARLEDAIAANLEHMFPQSPVRATCPFRITRDGDMTVDSDETGDLLSAIESALIDRRRSSVMRLEVPRHADKALYKFLIDRWELDRTQVYAIDGMLNAKSLFELAGRPDFEELKIADWPPQPPRDLIGSKDLFETLRSQDVMLIHPYESFDPVVHFVEQAADDPDVLAIKQILYRTSGDSPIVSALERAAESGKEVTVLVELKARFDEAQNVQWARRLEDAGCHVIYGIVGYKTHAKALLVVRRESSRIRRYAHLATGNYNDKTALIYSDIGLMTSDSDLTADVAAFFNLLTGYSETVGWSQLTIAPTDLRTRFENLIEREIEMATPDHPGLIMAKTNSLQDPGICRALYRASKAGVNVMLNVRGICCLRPGLKRHSQNIRVVSIVDRYLEHARIFYFANGGNEEIYLSSADWMTRNIDKRLETLFPVRDKKRKRRLIHVLETYFADNVKAHTLNADGSWTRVRNDKAAIRAQERLYKEAVEAAKSGSPAPVRFQPVTRPKKR